MYNSKLNWTLSYFSFYNYWVYFNFCFCFLIGIPIGITSSATGLKTCAITAGINKYKSVIKKKKKKHNKILFLAKSKLNKIEALIFKALIESVISHDEFIFINNMLKKYNEMKEEFKNLNT